MPARGPEPDPPHLHPRNVWLEAFKAELLRLKPHLATATKMVDAIAGGGLARHGVESDPAKAAQAWHNQTAS